MVISSQYARFAHIDIYLCIYFFVIIINILSLGTYVYRIKLKYHTLLVELPHLKKVVLVLQVFFCTCYLSEQDIFCGHCFILFVYGKIYSVCWFKAILQMLNIKAIQTRWEARVNLAGIWYKYQKRVITMYKGRQQNIVLT